MTVCKYFLRGSCNFGDRCKFEHPADGQRQSGFGNQWTTPRGNGNPTNQSWTNPNTTSANPKLDNLFTSDTILRDLTLMKDKPGWPLTSYAPAKYEPLLLPGLDESPEELRVRATIAKQSGKESEYLSYEAAQFNTAEQTFANARNNIAQAYEKARSQSLQTVSLPSTTNTTSGLSAFGNTTTSSVFGNATTPSAFGISAFGTPATTSAFGTPATISASGAPATTSAFGAPTTTSPFGAPATTSAFGKSAFGQPAFGQSAFGTPAAPAAAPTSAFGQSAFGQPTQPQAATTSAFGQASQPQSSLIKPASGAFGAFAGNGVSAFGGSAPATEGTVAPSGGAFSAFANQPSTFGAGATGGNAISNPQTGGSVFGQSSFGSSPAPATSAFGGLGTGTTTSVFGQPAFGQPAFGQPAFGQPSLGAAGGPAPTANSSGSVFGPGGSTSGGAFGSSASTSSPFGPSSQTNGSVFSQQSRQPVSAFAPAPDTQPPQSAFPSLSAMHEFPAIPPIPMAPPPPAAPGAPNFAAAIAAKMTYKPGSSPYDTKLPQDYISVLPEPALAAFKSEKFEWGKVPEWLPPIELR